MYIEETRRNLEATKDMLKLIENQHEEYVTRLRTENKNLLSRQKIEVTILEMGFEDVRSTCGKCLIFN